MSNNQDDLSPTMDDDQHVYRVCDFVDRLELGDLIFVRYHAPWYERILRSPMTFVHVLMFVDDGSVINQMHNVPYVVHSGTELFKADKNLTDEKYFRVHASPLRHFLQQLNDPTKRAYYSIDIRPLHCVRDESFRVAVHDSYMIVKNLFSGAAASRLLCHEAALYNTPSKCTEERWACSLLTRILFYMRIIPALKWSATVQLKLSDFAFCDTFFTPGLLGALAPFAQLE